MNQDEQEQEANKETENEVEVVGIFSAAGIPDIHGFSKQEIGGYKFCLELSRFFNTKFKYMYDKRTNMYEKHTLLSPPEVQVLEVFLDLQKHYFAELTKVTKLTRPRTLRILRKLVQQKILEVKPEANVKYYSLRKISPVYTALGMVEYSQTSLFLAKNKMLNRALEMLKEKYTDYLIMLIFGSVVKGYAAKASDIDLLLIKENFAESDIKNVEDIIDVVNGRTGLKISPYFMKVDEFKKRNDLAKEAIEHHILISGAELFYRLVLE